MYASKLFIRDLLEISKGFLARGVAGAVSKPGREDVEKRIISTTTRFFKRRGGKLGSKSGEITTEI